MDDQFTLTGPYCGEEVEIYIEPDVGGTLVHDCEVCCRPLEIRAVWEGGERWLDVRRSD